MKKVGIFLDLHPGRLKTLRVVLPESWAFRALIYIM